MTYCFRSQSENVNKFLRNHWCTFDERKSVSLLLCCDIYTETVLTISDWVRMAISISKMVPATISSLWLNFYLNITLLLTIHLDLVCFFLKNIFTHWGRQWVLRAIFRNGWKCNSADELIIIKNHLVLLKSVFVKNCFLKDAINSLTFHPST